MEIAPGELDLTIARELLAGRAPDTEFVASWPMSLSHIEREGLGITADALWLVGFLAGQSLARFRMDESSYRVTVEAQEHVHEFIRVAAEAAQAQGSNYVDVPAVNVAMGLCPLWPIC